MRHGLSSRKACTADAAGLHVAFYIVLLTSLRLVWRSPVSVAQFRRRRRSLWMVVADIANEVVVPATSIAITEFASWPPPFVFPHA